MENTEKIYQVINTLVSSYKNRDLGSLMGVMEDDAILIPNNSAPIVGREKIEHFYGHLLDEFDTESEVDIRDIDIAGSFATALITFKGTSTSRKSGDSFSYVNNNLIVLKSEGGHWKIFRNMWNSKS
jgi:uncharacterized protein (TIGR02246 family)